MPNAPHNVCAERSLPELLRLRVVNVTMPVALHHTATMKTLILDHAPIVVRLAVLLPLGPAQEHDPARLARRIRLWESGRSSLQRFLATTGPYFPLLSETYRSQSRAKSGIRGANPRRRVSVQRNLRPIQHHQQHVRWFHR